MILKKQQAMTSNKHAIGVFFLGGARPQAHNRLRQIVTCDNDSLDRQIDAWAAVQGHRRRHTHKLRKSNRCDTKANINFYLKMRCFDIVNLTNGGKNGITIRLHGFGHRRLDQRATRHSSKFLLDHDGNRYERGYEGEPGRNCFPNNVSSDAGSWSLDKALFFSFCKRSGSWNDRLQMQRGTRSALQIYPKMDQGRRKMAGRKVGEERRLFKIQKGVSRCQINLCSWFEKRSRKLLLSTIVKIVLLRQSKKSTRLFAAGTAGPSARWKSLNWVGRLSISLSSMVSTLHSAGKILENQNSFPPIPGQKWPGFFYAWKMDNRIKEQATSNMRQGSG